MFLFAKLIIKLVLFYKAGRITGTLKSSEHTQHVIKPQCGGWIILHIAFLGVDPCGLQFFHYAALVEI